LALIYLNTQIKYKASNQINDLRLVVNWWMKSIRVKMQNAELGVAYDCHPGSD